MDFFVAAQPGLPVWDNADARRVGVPGDG